MCIKQFLCVDIVENLESFTIENCIHIPEIKVIYNFIILFHISFLYYVYIHTYINESILTFFHLTIYGGYFSQ